MNFRLVTMGYSDFLMSKLKHEWKVKSLVKQMLSESFGSVDLV